MFLGSSVMVGGTILCPIDFSGVSSTAVATAVALARAEQGQLYLLHVVDLRGNHEPGGGDFTGRDLGELQDRLMRVAQETRDVVIERFLETGDAGERIVTFAAEAAVDLIVLGTNGRHAETTRGLGHVAKRVVEVAPCAVMTVTCPCSLERLRDEASLIGR